MATTNAHSLTYSNIEDYLGPGELRFFGEGYKRVQRSLESVALGADDVGTPYVTAVASVTYPADWSRKGDSDQRPHLSTIDVLLLGVQLSEIHLARHAGLTEAQLRTVWIRRARIKAGSRPVEDNLAGFDVVAQLDHVQPSFDHSDRQVSVMDCRVGALTIRIEIDHYIPIDNVPSDPAAVLVSNTETHAFGEAFEAHCMHVEDVFLSADRLHTKANVSFDIEHEAALGGGKRQVQPYVHMINMFVVALQLGQVMLYELDGINRAESNTLWMRSTLLESDTPRPHANTGVAFMMASLVDAELLHTRRGETWRRADITAQGGGVKVVCSVAHRLP